eukprot:4406889-Amphidinium_carterae.1
MSTREAWEDSQDWAVGRHWQKLGKMVAQFPGIDDPPEEPRTALAKKVELQGVGWRHVQEETR